jgi:hypothetical protein
MGSKTTILYHLLKNNISVRSKNWYTPPAPLRLGFLKIPYSLSPSKVADSPLPPPSTLNYALQPVVDYCGKLNLKARLAVVVSHQTVQ